MNGFEGPFTYPETEVQDVSETRFGTTVRDPYRWLEADVRLDVRVRAWVDAQSKYTADYLSRLPHREEIARRLTNVLNLELYSAPRKKGDRYFFQHNTGLQNQSPLYVQEGLNGTPRLLLDPNTWSDDGATALGEWSVSSDGRHLAYTVQDGGSDWRTIRVLDVDTGRVRSDELHWAKFTPLAWANDGSGFFYTRFPEPAKEARYQSANGNHMVCYHALGTDQSADRLVYSIPDTPNLLHYARKTNDGRYLVIITTENADRRCSVALVDLKHPERAPRALVPERENAYALAGSVGDTLYFFTDRNAARGSIVTMNVAQNDPEPVALIPESSDVLSGASLIGGRLIVGYMVDAKTEMKVFDLSGRQISSLELPGLGSITALEGDADDSEAFYSFESFAEPSTVYRYDVKTGASSVFKRPKTAFDGSKYATRQIFYTSKDGTRVPMFITHRKDLDLSKPQPTLLNAYGGFNIPRLPGFRGPWLAWMEMGGIFASANLRGGGEYGNAWHDGGRLLNKQNVFDDFIAAAEYLIAEKLTTPQQLAIQGGSNGGLLVGAVANQRPDLYAAVLAQVGVMDMLRFDQFTVGRYWTSDYGDPAEEQHFRNLLAISPYHNVKSGRTYPAILTTTADLDDRVVPSHSFKYAAATQAAEIGPKPHLIRIETRAGHGMGKPISKTIEENTDMWAFAGYFTGLTRGKDLPPPP